jgi:hypothetical protein
VEEFLRRYEGGDEYKKSKSTLRKKLKDPEVGKAIDSIQKSFGDMIVRYVNYCVAYPLSTRASKKRWFNMLTKKEIRHYSNIRAKIDATRKAANVKE